MSNIHIVNGQRVYIRNPELLPVDEVAEVVAEEIPVQEVVEDEENLDEEIEDNNISDGSDSGAGSNPWVWGNQSS